jgi:hypothetical protein
MIALGLNMSEMLMKINDRQMTVSLDTIISIVVPKIVSDFIAYIQDRHATTG